MSERSHDTRSTGAPHAEQRGSDALVAAPASRAGKERNGADAARVEAQRRLVEALLAQLSSSTSPVRLLETHISFVLLTGTLAYKIKKAVRLAFLDFSTLALRKKFCDEELRLNRRLAPDLYLDVVAITGTPAAPTIGGSGPALEYAVRMREFPQEGLLSNLLERNALTPAHIDQLAVRLAHFHAAADVADTDTRYGSPAHALALAMANFREVARLPEGVAERPALRSLRQWTRDEHAKIRSTLEERLRRGAVRECHGDLHLGNVALIDNVVTVFDCLEFNAAMRWMDRMSEVAFAVMDLVHRNHPALAYRLLNAYCERSGDYGGLAVLRFYLVYRAMVRAKVAALRAAQLTDPLRRKTFADEFAAHLRLATQLATDLRPVVAVMHGLSGSGKTTLSQMLLERAGAVRIRTDIERKRLAGLAAAARSGSDVAGGLYASDVTRQTYAYVRSLAGDVVRGGFPAIVDGAFLARWQRDLLRDLATGGDVPFVIVDCAARKATLEARLAARAVEGRDASEADSAVLAHQIATQEPLDCDELRFTLVCDAAAPFDAWPRRALDLVVDRLRARSAPPDGSERAHAQSGDLEAEVAFLSRPDSYTEGTTLVEPVETHLSWLFLTEHHAYKLKKPARDRRLDLREVAARRENCDNELQVNRRFGSSVYGELIPLTRRDRTLRIGGNGEVVDWLLRMRRLPGERMLDRVIAERRLDVSMLEPVIELVCSVYRNATVEITEDDHRCGLIDAIDENERELARPELAPRRHAVADLCARQRRFARDDRALATRIAERRIVEGHGDLRPEHICLDATPQIIDSLEFSRELRTLDAADELAFLALECERLGAPQARRAIFDAYRRASGDRPPDALIHFYQSFRACVRARLAIRHLLDPHVRDRRRWPVLATRYLDLAERHIHGCERLESRRKTVRARRRQ